MLVADMSTKATQTWIVEDAVCQLADLGDDRPDTAVIDAYYEEAAIIHRYVRCTVPVTPEGPGPVTLDLASHGYTCINCDEFKSSLVAECIKHFVVAHSMQVGSFFVCRYPLARGATCSKVIVSLVLGSFAILSLGAQTQQSV